MMYLLLASVVLLGAGLACTVSAAKHAPVGYEDETGFHFQPETSSRTETVKEIHGAVPIFGR
jgi:hypothetical protein